MLALPGAAGQRDLVNGVTINDRFGSFEDPTPEDNTASALRLASSPTISPRCTVMSTPCRIGVAP